MSLDSDIRYIAKEVATVDGYPLFSVTCTDKVLSNIEPIRVLGKHVATIDSVPLFAYSDCTFPEVGRYLMRHVSTIDGVPLFALACCGGSDCIACELTYCALSVSGVSDCCNFSYVSPTVSGDFKTANCTIAKSCIVGAKVFSLIYADSFTWGTFTDKDPCSTTQSGGYPGCDNETICHICLADQGTTVTNQDYAPSTSDLNQTMTAATITKVEVSIVGDQLTVNVYGLLILQAMYEYVTLMKILKKTETKTCKTRIVLDPDYEWVLETVTKYNWVNAPGSVPTLTGDPVTMPYWFIWAELAPGGSTTTLDCGCTETNVIDGPDSCVEATPAPCYALFVSDPCIEYFYETSTDNTYDRCAVWSGSTFQLIRTKTVTVDWCTVQNDAVVVNMTSADDVASPPFSGTAYVTKTSGVSNLCPIQACATALTTVFAPTGTSGATCANGLASKEQTIDTYRIQSADPVSPAADAELDYTFCDVTQVTVQLKAIGTC